MAPPALHTGLVWDWGASASGVGFGTVVPPYLDETYRPFVFDSELDLLYCSLGGLGTSCLPITTVQSLGGNNTAVVDTLEPLERVVGRSQDQ